MGSYFNPGNGLFQIASSSKIYVDKTEMIAYTNSVLCSEQRFICVSRPRRFGKSMAVNMLAAYYSKGCDSKELFSDKKIADCESYEKHRNKYHVLYLNMQEFLSKSKSVEEMFSIISRLFVKEAKKELKDEICAMNEYIMRIEQKKTILRESNNFFNEIYVSLNLISENLISKKFKCVFNSSNVHSPINFIFALLNIFFIKFKIFSEL